MESQNFHISNENNNGNQRRKRIVKEVKKQIWLAGPLVSVNLLQFSLQMISVMFVGHLGRLPLSGASMATSFANVTGFNFLSGMASALDTLCGQSHGAKQHHMMGILMQRAIFVLLLVSIPLAFMWAFTESLLILVHQDPVIAHEAGIYARFMIPALFAYAFLQCSTRFLQTQNIVIPMVFLTGITTLLHLPLCWFMVFKSGLESRGAAVANCISYWLNALLFAVYIKFSSSCQKSWNGFSSKAFENIVPFIRLAIPSALMICLEGWSFELMILLSGILPNPQLETSVLSICLNTSSTTWMIPFGLSCAVSTRISNELGAGQSAAARLAMFVTLAMVTIEVILIAAVYFSIRNVWGHVYSNDHQVIKYVANMLPILSVSHILDGYQSVISGVARGCGWQKTGAYVNFGSYYLVGIPCAVVLAFLLHMGGKGLWLGLTSALAVQLVCLSIITARTNWQQQATKAVERVTDSRNPEEEEVTSTSA